MSPQELSDQFEVLYNNIMSNAAPGLNEYEKSVFLTKAQSEIIKNYFNPQGNKYKEGYDGSAKRQMDFSMLMSNATISEQDSSGGYDPRGKNFVLPDNVLILVNESVVLLNEDNEQSGVRQVVPIAYDEYARLMSKPYKEPLKNQAWRLINGQNNDAHGITPMAELIVNKNDVDRYKVYYKIRFIRKPRPIITANLGSEVGDVTIDGLSGPCPCELDATIHEEILQRAVELAKASYASDQNGTAQLQNQITVGQRSE